MNPSVNRTNVRFHMDNEDERRAWEYLQHIDRTRHKSCNRVIITAVNEYFERQERLETDPFLESREREEAFLKRIENTIERCLGFDSPLVSLLLKFSDQGSTQTTRTEPAEDMDSGEMEDITFDFLNSL